MKLVLHIDSVVLEGMAFTPHQRDQLQLALVDELAAQLAGRALTPELATGTALRRMTAGPVTLPHHVPAGKVAGNLAAGVAESVANGLAGPSRARTS